MTVQVQRIATEYFGTDGQIRYRIKPGAPIEDTNALPADGCTVAGTDTSAIYADNSGYDACLDDDQIIAEPAASSLLRACRMISRTST